MAAALRDAAGPPALRAEITAGKAEQLGLYVAARLAQRHGIRITLRPSPFGGTTAIVLIPHDLIITDANDGGKPAGPAAVAPRTGRHGSGTCQRPTRFARCRHRPARGPAGPLWRRPQRHPAALAPTSHSIRGCPYGPGRRACRTICGPPARRPTARPTGPQPAGPPATHGVAEHEAAPYPDPSADDVRSAMTAMQRGWERGRAEPWDYGAMAEADGEGHPGPGRDSALSRRSTSDDA